MCVNEVLIFVVWGIFSSFSYSVSNLFLSSNTYLSLISLLLRRVVKVLLRCLVVAVRVAFFRRLSRIFAVTIRWSVCLAIHRTIFPFLIYNHHHHHIVLVARISLTLFRHSSLSFIALGRSSRQHPVSSHSCWMYVRAGRPAFARPCVGIHKSTSLMSSSLLLQQCPACLVRLTWIVFVIGGRWPYS